MSRRNSSPVGSPTCRYRWLPRRSNNFAQLDFCARIQVNFSARGASRLFVCLVAEHFPCVTNAGRVAAHVFESDHHALSSAGKRASGLSQLPVISRGERKYTADI